MNKKHHNKNKTTKNRYKKITKTGKPKHHKKNKTHKTKNKNTTNQ